MPFVKKKTRTMKVATLFLLVCLAFVSMLGMCGCQKKQDLPDPFFEKWKKLAEESKGYSPELSRESLDIEQGSNMQEVLFEKEKKKVAKPLPSMPTTLDVHDTEIRAVLQALAKAAKQNILINSNIKGLVTVRFLKIPWSQAFNALLKSNGLTYTWEGDIIRVVSIEDMKQQLAIEEVKARIEAQDVAIRKMEPFRTRIIKVKYADIDEIKDSLLSVLGSNAPEESSLELTAEQSSSAKGDFQRGNIFADKHTNSLIIMARPADMEMLTTVLAALDRPTKQVYLKAHIVETTKGTGRELGMQWGGTWSNKLSGSSDRATFGSPVGDDDGTSTNLFGTGNSETGFSSNFPISQIVSPGMGTAGLGLNFMLGEIGKDILEAQLTALQTRGKLNILSSPSLTTMDNQMAFTENGAKVPYVSYDDGDKTVEFEDAVLRLEMTPHVIDTKHIKMKIRVKKDEVDFSDQLKVDGNPTILKKETSTNLVVRNNETIVISGLSKQTLTESTSGVPGLADIPGLGWLFKGNSKNDEMEEILIFVTPTILETPSSRPVRAEESASSPSLPPPAAE
jgi:type IV pilus assembly protein PilQ